MKKANGCFPSREAAELAAGRLKDECHGGECILSDISAVPQEQTFSPDLEVTPRTPPDGGVWASVVAVPDLQLSGETGRCTLCYTGTDQQTEKAAHVLRSLGADSITITDA